MTIIGIIVYAVAGAISAFYLLGYVVVFINHLYRKARRELLEESMWRIESEGRFFGALYDAGEAGISRAELGRAVSETDEWISSRLRTLYRYGYVYCSSTGRWVLNLPTTKEIGVTGKHVPW